MKKNNKTTTYYLKVSSIFYFLFFLWRIYKNLKIHLNFIDFIIYIILQFLMIFIPILLFSLILSFLLYLIFNKLFKKYKTKYKKYLDYFSPVFMISSIIFILLGSAILNLGMDNNPLKNNINDLHIDINNSSDFIEDKNWYGFNSAEQKFKIDFPTSPTHEKSPNNANSSPEVDIYYSGQSDFDKYYSVVVLTFLSKAEVSNPELLMKNLINNITGTEGKAILSNFTYYKGNKALDFEIRGKNTDSFAYIKGKLILADQTLYNLLTRYKESNYDNDTNHKKFINSFELNN